MAVAAIALTGCNNPKNNPKNEPEIDPEAPENGLLDRHPLVNPTTTVECTCSCGTEYTVTYQEPVGTFVITPGYLDHTSPHNGWNVLLDGKTYPYVTFNDHICYWRCKCGKYHKVAADKLVHIEIPDGEQPEELVYFNKLWE